MEKNQKIVLVMGALITLGLVFIDTFFALIALIIVLVLLMSFRIMGDSGNYPLVAVELSEDAREIIVTNTGTARAQNIHVALVPLDIDFEIASLDPDEESGFGLASMLVEAKAVVTYENDEGQQFTRSYPLTALGAGRDLLEPVFPIFGRR
ncbi:MAG: hypothetical protein XD82_1727 [Methanoculleus marisnigri]|jgi:hypothetical protein|uniref:Uncharacterized protein n=1 Tax=Methanoculleus marisnigri TaxID=2198 RepID=A0A124FRS0_9EURY|nr:hypothetical protein [Methanoculleus marisnigri]KUK59997.1 MAG: hypothetical protein XD82_1727 [Methanoculleus marisnigri]